MKHQLSVPVRFLVSASIAVLFTVPACVVAQRGATKTEISPSATNSPGLAEVIRLYESDRGSVSRFYDLPWSEKRFDRLEKLLKDWQERLKSVDFDTLDQPGRIDYTLLRNKLTSELARIALD